MQFWGFGFPCYHFREGQRGREWANLHSQRTKNGQKYSAIRIFQESVYRTFVNLVKKVERILTSHIYHVNQESQTGKIHNFRCTSIL